MMYLYDYIPFVYRRSTDSEGVHRVDYKTIINGVIVALLTTFFSMYAAQAVLKAELRSSREKTQIKLNAISSDIEDIKNNQRDFRNDFYIPKR